MSWYQKYRTESIAQLIQTKAHFNSTCEINTKLLDHILPSQLWHTHYSESEWFFPRLVSAAPFTLFMRWQRNGTCAKPGSGSHSRSPYTHTVGTPPPPPRIYFRSKKQLIVLYFFELYSQLKQNINCTLLYSAIQDIGGSSVLIDWLNTGKARSI